MTVRDLNLAEVLLNALRAPFENWKAALFAYCVFVVVPWFVTDQIQGYMFGQPTLFFESAEVQQTSSMSGWAFWMYMLLLARSTCYVGFAVLVHRLVAAIPNPWQILNGVVGYIAVSLIFTAIVLVPYAAFFFVTVDWALEARESFTGWLLQSLVTGTFLAVVSCRFALAFPAAALGKDKPLRRSIHLTRHHWLHVIVGILLTSFVAASLFSILGFLLEPLLTGCSVFGNLPAQGDCQPSLIIQAALDVMYLTLSYIPAVIAVSFLTQMFVMLSRSQSSIGARAEPT